MLSGPQVGDLAPDFELVGTEGPFRLSAYRGSPVVLLFYPGDGLPLCARQFRSYRDRRDELAELDAVLVGISHQDVASHARFIDRHALTVPLLADPDRRVAQLYGVAAAPRRTRRASFVVDGPGIVRHRRVHGLDLGFEDVDDLRAALGALPAPA
jgi:peroxiredoxin Q/BCP